MAQLFNVLLLEEFYVIYLFLGSVVVKMTELAAAMKSRGIMTMIIILSLVHGH